MLLLPALDRLKLDPSRAEGKLGGLLVRLELYIITVLVVLRVKRIRKKGH